MANNGARYTTNIPPSAVTPEQREGLERVAEANGVNLSTVIRWAVDFFLSHDYHQTKGKITIRRSADGE